MLDINNPKPEDRIKIHRCILLEYNGHQYNAGDHQVYQRAGGWEPVRRAVRDLCIQDGIHIKLDRYPKTRLITITLNYEERPEPEQSTGSDL